MADYISYESLLSLGGTVKSYIDENDIGIEVSNGSVQIFSKWDEENSKWAIKGSTSGSTIIPISTIGDDIASIVDESGSTDTIKNNIEAMSGSAIGFDGLTFNW